MKQVFFSKGFIDIVPNHAGYSRRKPYWIPVSRLDEDWIRHLKIKVWWTDELERQFKLAVEGHKKKWGTGKYGQSL